MAILIAALPIKKLLLPRVHVHQYVHHISKPSANIINQHRPSPKCPPLPAVVGDGGGGDNSGGNGGRMWIDSSSNNDDDNNNNNQRRLSNIGPIMAIITLSLIFYASHLRHQHTASSATQQQDQDDQEDPSLVFDTDDIQSIKRLLREAFSEFVKLRRRISTLEDIAEVDPLEDEEQYQEDDDVSSSRSSGTPLPHHHHHHHSRGKEGGKSSSSGGSILGRRKGLLSSHQHQGSTVLHGTVDYGTALSWPLLSTEEVEEEAASSSSSSSSVAIIKQGAEMKFHTTASVRNNSDDVTVVCTTTNDNFILEKVMYLCRLTSQLRAVVIPLGGRGQDIAYTLNPVAGQGLTGMVRHGSPLHQEPLGAVAGVAVDLDKAWFSGGVFNNNSNNNSSGGGGDHFPLLRALHTNNRNGDTHREKEKGVLVQGAVALSHDVSLGAILKQKISPSNSSGSGSVREMGLMGAMRIGTAAALHSWTRLKLGDDSSYRGVDGWGCCVAAYPYSNNEEEGGGGGNGWTVGVGRVNHKGGGGGRGGRGGVLVPNVCEVSMQVDMGGGVSLTPGLVVVVGEGGRREAMLGVRTTLAF
jgi:hypothetical protein